MKRKRFYANTGIHIYIYMFVQEELFPAWIKNLPVNRRLILS